MQRLKGYRTVVVNAVAVLAALAGSLFGVDLDAEAQASIVAVVMGIANIALRFVTDTPVGSDRPRGTLR